MITLTYLTSSLFFAYLLASLLQLQHHFTFHFRFGGIDTSLNFLFDFVASSLQLLFDAFLDEQLDALGCLLFDNLGQKKDFKITLHSYIAY